MARVRWLVRSESASQSKRFAPEGSHTQTELACGARYAMRRRSIWKGEEASGSYRVDARTVRNGRKENDHN